MKSSLELMLRVEPIYGWGWFSGDVPTAVEAPPEFDLSVRVITPDETRVFRAAIGRVAVEGHPLNGMWIFLSPRHFVDDGLCNLSVFHNEPAIPNLKSPGQELTTPMPPSDVSGFASVAVISADKK
jgi:hypothetical protein